MTARFICDANYLPCAVELSGRSYTLAEIESIVGAALEYRAAVEESNGIVAAEQRLFAVLGELPQVGPSLCALCRTPITQPARGRKRKYCDGCATKLGHRTTTELSRRMARKKPQG